MKKLYLLIMLLFLFVRSEAQSPQLWGVIPYGGSAQYGSIYTIDSSGKNFNPQFSFTPNPANPQGLVKAADGLFYGTTILGGTYDSGVIYSFNPVNGSIKVLHCFGGANDGDEPTGTPIQATNGLLYGLTTTGGTYADGILYSYDITTATYSVLYNFGSANDAYEPHGTLFQASDGLLYGSSLYGGQYYEGTLFRFNISTGTDSILYSSYGGSFDENVMSTLVEAKNGLLYGTNQFGYPNNEGYIFSFNISTGSYTIEYSFGKNNNDGAYPVGIIQVANGLLYGDTWSGGGNGQNGTIFSFNTATDSEQILHTFASSGIDEMPESPLFQSSNGLIYGMSNGYQNVNEFFSFDTSSKAVTDILQFNTNTTGSFVRGGFIEDADSLIYGVKGGGGIYGDGTIFNYNPKTDSVTVKSNFGAGHGPQSIVPTSTALLLANNGLLYGATVWGGRDSGSIFSYNMSTGILTNLYNFDEGTDGQDPSAPLIQATNGLLYGSTGWGGKFDGGTIYSYNIATNVETDLYDFPVTVLGGGVFGSLIQADNGLLYGLTYAGSTDSGSLFSFDIANNAFTSLVDLGKTTGFYPGCSPIQASDSLLYATTTNGGTYDNGTLFSYNIITGNINVLHNFGSDTDGAAPVSIIKASNGLIYGLTNAGGVNDFGTIFSFNLLNDSEKVLYSLPFLGLGNPSSLMQASDGNLYGIALAYYGNFEGGVFKYNIATGIEKDIYIFNLTGIPAAGGQLIEVDSSVSTVWPGDANDDLTVNNFDLLPIGVYNGSKGSARDTITNTWAAHKAQDWHMQQGNGRDLKYADCNGDGIINADDTMAVSVNYAQHHLFYSAIKNPYYQQGMVRLFLTDSGPYTPGSNAHVEVWLDDSVVSAKGIYGVAYNISVDTTQIEPRTLMFNNDNSFLGTINTDALSLYRIGGDVESAFVRTDHHNKTGMGKIGDLYFTIDPNTIETRLLISIIYSQVIDSAGNIINTPSFNDSISIQQATGINQSRLSRDRFSIYPNPTCSTITITSEKNIDEITITNLLGQVVYTLSENAGMKRQIDLSKLANGVYFVTIKSGNEMVTRKISVIE